MTTPPLFDEDYISRVIRNGLAERVEEIINEESEQASKRVAERVNGLKENAIQNILTRFKMTRRENYPTMELVLKFDI